MKILGHTLIKRLKFISVFGVQYKDCNDQIKSWELVSRQRIPKCISGRLEQPDAVIIVPIHDPTEKLCVIREFRVPLGTYEWGFPAGLVDKGESVENAVERELFEETGLQLVRVLRYSPPVFSSAGVTDEAVQIVFVEAKGQLSHTHHQGSEDIECFLYGRQSLKVLLNQKNAHFGARSWPIIDAFSRYGAAYLA